MISPPASALKDIGLHEQITAIRVDGSSSNCGSKSADDSADPAPSCYPIDKLEAHILNVPHMAISIFVFKQQKLLLQQRALTKYHSGGLWANTVCSHPRWNETPTNCAARRLNEELGLSVTLHEFGKIAYQAKVGDLYENERVHCFYGEVEACQNITALNQIEVAAVRWMSIAEILDEMGSKPETFTEWFKIYMTKHRGMITERTLGNRA